MMGQIGAFFATALGRVLAVLVLMAVVMWGYSTFADGRRAKVEARLNKEQAGAALESGQDAVNTVGGVSASDAATDAITRSNERDIRNAPGAAAPVDPGLDAAAREALCRRAAYKDSPSCLTR